MKNLNDNCIDSLSRAYDLKGSTVGRKVIKEEDVSFSELHLYNTLKDLDFNKYEKRIQMKHQFKLKLLDTLKSDTKFLSSLGLLDYSLILYIFDKNLYMKNNGLLGLQNDAAMKNSFDDEYKKRNFALIESEDGNWYYKLGIIDYLRIYDFEKQLEHVSKKLIKGATPTIVSPDQYKERFQKAMKRYFMSVHSDET